MNKELKRTAPPLKTVYRPMSSDNFLVSNSYKLELVLSYVFQIRKQERKYFFRRAGTHFFLKIFSKKDGSAFPAKKPATI